MVVLSVRGGGDLKLVLGQVDCRCGVGKVNGDIDQVGSLGPDNYLQLNKCEDDSISHHGDPQVLFLQ